jgi:hypothetical protein
MAEPHEPHEQLGGRVRSWPVLHGDDHFTMSRRFHALFRQYYNLRALRRRIDPDLQSLVQSRTTRRTRGSCWLETAYAATFSRTHGARRNDRIPCCSAVSA